MNMEARVGVVVEGSQRALNSAAHGSVVDAGTRKFLQQHSHGGQSKQLQKSQIDGQVKPGSLSQQSQIGTIQQLLAGGVAGAFSKTCTAPLARLTILFQVGFVFSMKMRVVLIWVIVNLGFDCESCDF